MKLTRISDPPCDDADWCPTVYATDRGTAVVQGYELGAEALAQLNLPPGEGAVEVPVAVLLSGAAGLEGRR